MTRRRTHRRAGYAQAIQWLADNDDNDWLGADAVGTNGQDGLVLSVSASLVADLFGRTDGEVARDLRRNLGK